MYVLIDSSLPTVLQNHFENIKNHEIQRYIANSYNKKTKRIIAPISQITNHIETDDTSFTYACGNFPIHSNDCSRMTGIKDPVDHMIYINRYILTNKRI